MHVLFDDEESEGSWGGGSEPVKFCGGGAWLGWEVVTTECLHNGYKSITPC